MTAKNEEKAVEVDCPYCGETIELLVDGSQGEQDYVEDCQVCCRPMKVHAAIDEDGVPEIQVAQEDET